MAGYTTSTTGSPSNARTSAQRQPQFPAIEKHTIAYRVHSRRSQARHRRAVHLQVDGQVVKERIPKTVPFVFSADEERGRGGMDQGGDRRIAGL